MKDTCASKIIRIKLYTVSSAAAAIHYQNLIIIHGCSKKLLEMRNSNSFLNT